MKPLFLALLQAVLQTIDEADAPFNIQDKGFRTDTQFKKMLNPETKEEYYCYNFALITKDPKIRDAVDEIFKSLADQDSETYLDLSKRFRTLRLRRNT